MISVLVIAPYAGLMELINSLKDNFPEMKIDVEVGNLEEGLAAARRMLKTTNYDVVISRGGTCSILERELFVPVVNIDMSSYDFLRVIKLAGSFPGKAAVIGFPNIIQHAKVACEILEISVDMFSIKDNRDVITLLAQLSKNGYGAFIGDVMTVKAARGSGSNVILLTSGIESVTAAFNEAARIVKHLRRYKRRDTLLTAAIKAQREALIIYDNDNSCVFQSHPLDDQVENLALTALKGQSEESILIDNGNPYHIKRNAIMIGSAPHTVLSIKKTHLPGIEEQGVTIYNDSQHLESFDYLNSQITYIQTIARQTAQIAKTDQGVLITGAFGTGKSRLAYTIYRQSDYSNVPLMILDCEAISDERWTSLLESSSFPGLERATLYIQKLDYLSKNSQNKLYNILKQLNRSGQYRLLFSANESRVTEDFVSFLSKLSEHLSVIKVSLPPLTERRDDIPYLASLLINEANIKYGKQIIGFDPDALAALMSHYWPQNIDQLVRVVKQLVLTSTDYYIHQRDVEAVFRSEKSVVATNISLDKTLDEITDEVIRVVMQQENGNQSAAAKRLGISRGTLWRRSKGE